MSLSGLCEVCGRPGVTHSCDRCGKLVCDRHFDDDVGVCAECAAQLRGRDPSSENPSDGRDGVDTYRF